MHEHETQRKGRIHPQTGGNAQERLALARAGHSGQGRLLILMAFPRKAGSLQFQNIAYVHIGKVTLPSIPCTRSAYFIAGICFPAACVK